MSESRLWTTEYERSAPGRTLVGILAGSGKRCECGAKHFWLGRVSER